MATPHSLEDGLRRHDEAVYRWLGGCTVDYGSISGTLRDNHPILRVLATPDRAWGEVVNQLVSQAWISAPDAQAMRAKSKADFAVLPLPLVSFERGEPTPNLEGSGVPKRFRRQQFLQPTQQWEEHPWPGAYRLEYRVTAWSLKRFTSNYIREWLYSQLGQIGAAETEVFIMVDHGAPWGQLKQALKLDGSSDLSNLEGEESRFIRTEYTLVLNMLHFRLPTATYDFQDTVAVGEAALDGVDPSESDPLLQVGIDLAPAVESGNLYQPYYPSAGIPTLWPKAGAASVANSTVTPDGRPDRGALLITVDAPADQVDITNRPIGLDIDEQAVLSVAFSFRSDAATALDVQQHDGSLPNAPVWTRQDLFALPAAPAWTKVHLFTGVTQAIFDLAVIGQSTPATLRIARIRVKHLKSGTKVPATSSSVVLSDTRYEWTGLPTTPFLVCLFLLMNGSSGTVTVEDDATAPGFTDARAISDSTTRALVFLVQPKTTSLVLLVPTAFAIAGVYLQRYDGGYGGNDL